MEVVEVAIGCITTILFEMVIILSYKKLVGHPLNMTFKKLLVILILIFFLFHLVNVLNINMFVCIYVK